MPDWLEYDPRNFKLITDDAASGAVFTGKKLKKRDSYIVMADHVNQQCCTNWTWSQTETRYRSYKKQYMKLK
jgi:hypothetical protein